MATVQQQISLSEKRRQRALALQPQTPSYVPQVYDETTTQGQVLATRQQIGQARTPLQQFKSQYLFPKKRERAFTDRKTRAGIVQAGQGVAEQLGQIQQQEQTFEREVATKAPEYALQAQKQQALMEARQSIQKRIDDLQARIQKRLDYIERKRQDTSDKNRSEYINDAEDDISVYQAELNEYKKGIGLGEDTLIKQHFSGYLQEKAQYEADRRQASIDRQADFRRMRQDPKFQETLKQLGLDNKPYVSLSQFESAVGKFNQNVAYQNQLLKFAEQKGGVQFLNPAQQKALGFDSQGFDYYKTPQKGWVDPRTGQVVEMSFINDQTPKNLGYLPVQIQGYNKQTGQYITDSSSSLMTSQQKRMYETFQKTPSAAGLFGYKIDQSAMLPTSFILGGTSQGVPQPQRVNVFEQRFGPKQPTSAFDVASRMQPFTTKESQIMEYKQNPQAFEAKYGYGLTAKGEKIIAGEASQLLLTDIAKPVIALKLAGPLGAAKAFGLTFSEQIKAPIDYAYQKSYQPTSFAGQFGKASLTSALVLSSPTLSASYGYSFLKSAATDPRAVWESVKQQAQERPGELLGFAVGGKLLQKGIGLAEYKLRGGVETKKVNLPGYGEVIVQNIPKFKQVVWIKGAFSASEKVKIMTQINSLLGKGNRVFVQVSPQGIPMQVFSATKNLGFKVSQLQNPMRGLYQAPPFQFLKKYQSLVNTKTGATSYYAGQFRRDSILPNPLKAIKALLTKDTITKQRPFQYLERTGTGVQTPKWIQSVAKALDSGKGIPKNYQAIINKYFKAFMDKPLEYRGKTYVGLEKLKLVNQINLRGRGSGAKLKVYAALLEYQNLNRVKLVGGAEVLSGIAPFGPESQVVVALGTKVFAKSAKDLRVGVKPTITSKIIEFVTGTKRGQYVSRIDGQLVEIMPIRSFPGKVKVKLPKVTKKDVASFDNLLVQGSKVTKGKIVTSSAPRPMGVFEALVDVYRYGLPRDNVAPLRPFPLTQRTQEVRRVDRPIISRNPLIVVRDEIRRPEQRRPLDRIIPRAPVRATRDRPIQRARPEIRRPDIREPRRDLLIPRRPDVVRRPEPRPIQRPTQNQLMRTLTIRPRPEERRQPVRKPIRKPVRASVLPTITQQIYRIKRRGGRVKKARGFEIARL